MNYELLVGYQKALYCGRIIPFLLPTLHRQIVGEAVPIHNPQPQKPQRLTAPTSRNVLEQVLPSHKLVQPGIVDEPNLRTHCHPSDFS
jgi:hypothetical protein